MPMPSDRGVGSSEAAEVELMLGDGCGEIINDAAGESTSPAEESFRSFEIVEVGRNESVSKEKVRCTLSNCTVSSKPIHK